MESQNQKRFKGPQGVPLGFQKYQRPFGIVSECLKGF